MFFGKTIFVWACYLSLVIAQLAPAEESDFTAQTLTLDAKGTPRAEDWFDRFQRVIQQRIHGSSESVDRFISGGIEDQTVTKHHSKADVSIDMLLGDGFEASLDLDISIHLELPRTERKLGLVLTTSNPDELPGESPEDTENTMYAGIRRSFSRKRIPHADVSLSVKVKSPPVALGQIRFGREYKVNNLSLFPFQKAYWLSDDGFGEVTGLGSIYWLKPRIITRTLSAVRWSEVSEGLEWQQAMLIGYTTRKGGYKGLDRGVGLRASIHGHKSGSGTVDDYRLSLVARRALHRPWFFLRFGPQVDWSDDEDWEPNYSFRIGFDTLFWAAQDLLGTTS